MSKVVFAAVLSFLLLAGCGRQEPASAQNGALEAGANGIGNESPAEPEPAGSPVNGLDSPVPPPDAVSHPNGYLPPAPEAEPANSGSPGPDPAPPATEDQYIRNGQ